MEFVLDEQTSPRSLYLQIKARIQHVPRSHSSEIERCSVLVCGSCEVSISLQCLCGIVQLGSVFADLYSLHLRHSSVSVFLPTASCGSVGWGHARRAKLLGVRPRGSTFGSCRRLTSVLVDFKTS